MNLTLQIQMPDASQPDEKKPYCPSIEDKVQSMLELVESGYCSNIEWLTLNKLCDALKQKPQTPRIQNLLGMIQPVLNKYGYHDSSATEDTRSNS